METSPFTKWDAQFRPMRADDIEPVLEIERRNFRTPWTRRAFLSEIEAAPMSQPLVIEYDSRIIGYVAPWFVVDELQIVKIAIHENFRRHGLARRLITHLCEAAQQKNCKVAHLEVRHTNTAARQLYESLGFKTTTVRRAYYGPAEDALLMSKNLG